MNAGSIEYRTIPFLNGFDFEMIEMKPKPRNKKNEEAFLFEFPKQRILFISQSTVNIDILLCGRYQSVNVVITRKILLIHILR
jgi:hypothetical protein